MVNNSPVLGELHQVVATRIPMHDAAEDQRGSVETQLRTPIRFQKFAGA